MAENTATPAGGTSPTPVVRIDRYGREVRIDTWGLEWVRDEDGSAFYITDCCDASAKGMEDCTGCRSCYNEVDSGLGGIPAPHPGDCNASDIAAAERMRALMAEHLPAKS